MTPTRNITLPSFLPPVPACPSPKTRNFTAAVLASSAFRGRPHHPLRRRRAHGTHFTLSTGAADRARTIRVIRPKAVAYTVESLVTDEEVCVPCGGETARVSLKVENLGGRRRRVSGGVDIDASVERVWDVLTKYEFNEQYMPNIVKSEVERLRGGDVLLEQIGIISRSLRLQTRMVMRVTEDFERFLITFSKVEGKDFSEFEGGYALKRLGPNESRLEYEIIAIPMPLFPVSLVERKITKEVPGMLASIRQESLEGKYIPLS